MKSEKTVLAKNLCLQPMLSSFQTDSFFLDGPFCGRLTGLGH
jgi:hypothetical protein